MAQSMSKRPFRNTAGDQQDPSFLGDFTWVVTWVMNSSGSTDSYVKVFVGKWSLTENLKEGPTSSYIS
jgi:hypothetical protein